MSVSTVRYATWAIAIVLGWFILTPKGPIPIVHADPAALMLGILALGVSVVALRSSIREAGFDPQPEPPKTWPALLTIVAATLTFAYGFFFVIPGGLQTIATHATLSLVMGILAIAVGLGGFLSRWA